jgi:ABC-2 type transport system ATP-binding protein
MEEVSATSNTLAPAPSPGGNGQFPDIPLGSTLLEVDDVTVSFGTFTAVRNASFSLRAGTLLGLIGPNGAGKTTLLRAIAALQPITRGSIKILGEPRTPGDEDAARMIGFTPDVPPAYDALTVSQFLEFVAAGYGVTPENACPLIDFWLEKVWLTDKKKQRVRTLSRGMKQRLGIARTLLPNPQIILLDEPAAGLDPAGRAQFRKLLTDLRDQGKTLLVSSHILSDMEEYCTHIAIMSHGKLVRFGTIREISEGIDNGRCRYTIELSEPVAHLPDVVSEIAGAQLVSSQRLEAELEFWSDRSRATQLLRELVAKGIPVAGFSANATGLEDAYLRAGIRQVD